MWLGRLLWLTDATCLDHIRILNGIIVSSLLV